MQNSKQARIEVEINWESVDAIHHERRYFHKINFWRDFFPGLLADEIQHSEPMQWVSTRTDSSEHLGNNDPARLLTLKWDSNRILKTKQKLVIPQTGRFYPRNLIDYDTRIYPDDMRPLRIIAQQGGEVVVDLNHPLAGRSIEVRCRVIEWLDDAEEHGGQCHDIVSDTLANGPGMQQALVNARTDFYSQQPFSRLIEDAEAETWNSVREQQLFDETASDQLEDHVSRLIAGSNRVLDLMSSSNSHLANRPNEVSVTGVGLDNTAMSNNPVLDRYHVQDINRIPQLSFADSNSFDLVMLNGAVEYLSDPFAVIAEIHRVLRPGGQVLVGFSDHWLKPKIVSIWQALHPFERPGLVLDYLRQHGGFSQLETFSTRGWPQAENDAMTERRIEADPLFIVTAARSERG